MLQVEITPDYLLVTTQNDQFYSYAETIAPRLFADDSNAYNLQLLIEEILMDDSYEGILDSFTFDCEHSKFTMVYKAGDKITPQAIVQCVGLVGIMNNLLIEKYIEAVKKQLTQKIKVVDLRNENKTIVKFY